MIERNVFLYWVGYEYKLIKILRDLIYMHSQNGKGYNVHIITDKNVEKYIKNVPTYFYKLLPAHQADFVRVDVICRYGGIWLDSDTLILDKLDSLFDIIENKGGFFIKENNNHICNGVFGSKANTPVMINWSVRLKEILEKKQNKIQWNEIGSHIVNNIYNNNKIIFNDYHIFNGLDNLYPVNWSNCIDEYINKPYDNYNNIMREYQPLIILVNSVYKDLDSLSKEEIMNSNLPLNYFINKSIENKTS